MTRLPLLLAALCLVPATRAQNGPTPVSVADLRLTRPAEPEPLAALRSLPPRQQRTRAAELMRDLEGRATRSADEAERLSVLRLYRLTQAAEFRDASAELEAKIDEAKPWAAEGLRARRLNRLAEQLALGDGAKKAAALQELDQLITEAAKGGPLAPTVLTVAFDAVQHSLWSIADSADPEEMKQRVNRWTALLVEALPSDAAALRRAAQLHGRMAWVARWHRLDAIAADQAARGRELDQALISIAEPDAHDLLMAAQHRLWLGNKVEARALLWKLESRPPATRFAGPPERVREDWIRMALLTYGIDGQRMKAGRETVEAAAKSAARPPSLPEVVLTPETATSVTDTQLDILRIQLDPRRPGPSREYLFLGQLRHAIHSLERLANTKPLELDALLGAFAAGSRDQIKAAATELRQPFSFAALPAWSDRPALPLATLRNRVEAVVAAERALLSWTSREPHTGGYERAVAQFVIEALHHELSRVAGFPSAFAYGTFDETSAAVLPAFGLDASQGKAAALIPAPYEESWRSVQAALCISYLRRASTLATLAETRSVSASARKLQSLAASLAPHLLPELRQVSDDYNAKLRKQEELAAAERAARAAEERRRAEEARVARERSEAAAREQAAARAQQERAAAAEPRFRWCMRCAGTGTYAQYVDETNYGRTTRVQKQVRCDRCWGTGKLP